MPSYITHCPVCQCQIITKGKITKSHETYIECIEALISELTNQFNGMLYTLKRIISVMRLEIKKRNEIQDELNKVYEVDK